MLPLDRDRTVGAALEEFGNVSKHAAPFAAPQQETIRQTYLAECDVDVCLLSPLNTTQNCVTNYARKRDESVRGCCFFNMLFIGARK